MKIVYTADIDEDIYGADYLLGEIDAKIEAEIGCKVVRSKIETEEEICENGEWEEDEDE